MKKRFIYLFFSIFLFVLGIFLSHTYRPYIYNNNIFDFHIADTIGNLVAVPSAVFFYYAIKEKHRKLKYVICMTVLAFILYELLGLFRLHGTFDSYDMIATLTSGLITYLVLNKVQNCQK